MAESKERKHVVMFPYMAQGHFIPFLSLAKMLASHGLNVSFLTTTANASKLQSQAGRSSIRFVSLSLPPINGLPPACESTDLLTPIQSMLLFISSHNLSQPFEEWLEQVIAETTRKPICIISDVFLPWTAQSASKFGIPRVVFQTTGAMAASLLQYLFTNPVSLSLLPIHNLPPSYESTDVLTHIQGQLLFISSHKLSHSFEEWLEKVIAETSRKPTYIISDVFLPWRAQSDSKFEILGVVFQTTGAMAGSLLQYLFTNPVLEIISDRQIIEIRDRCINVNLRRSELPPMLRSELSELFVSRSPGDTSLEQAYRLQHVVDNESECIRWLDTQKQNSVLYVSFGSQAFLSADQTKALAKGIAGSQQRFIWTIKDPVRDQVNSCDFLPEGFIEETRERGMVIHGWVPQLLILSHSSTAFFMTHCGWNSTLESISAGVPMVLWPMAFEQFINAKLVIEQLGLGLQICEGLDVIPSSDIVENTVKAAMATEMGEDMRQQALKIKESINEASCKLSGIKGFVSYILSLGSR